MISKRAVVRLDLTEDLPSVQADVTQMRQVIMNLITNASDALEDNNGTITICTGVTQVDRDYLASTHLDEELPTGTYVYLEVSDTGVGMDRATRGRIFDPFFTTKFAGRGLGLAAVLGIIRGHQGAIKVYSEPGKGTSVKVLLPAASSRPSARRSPCRGRLSGRPPVLLLVDDDEMVRGVTRLALERKGCCRVITGKDGVDGLELFSPAPEEVIWWCWTDHAPHVRRGNLPADAPSQARGAGAAPTATTSRRPPTAHRQGPGRFIQKPFTPLGAAPQISPSCPTISSPPISRGGPPRRPPPRGGASFNGESIHWKSPPRLAIVGFANLGGRPVQGALSRIRVRPLPGPGAPAQEQGFGSARP